MTKLQETLQTAFGRADDAFEGQVRTTLEKLMKDEEKRPVKRKMTLSIALACVLALALGYAVAASLSPVADIFGWFYGDEYREGMLATGDSAPVGQSFTLGDVTYTLDEVVYYDNADDPISPALYGTGFIRPKDGVSVVLMPEDFSVTDPAGYILHMGEDDKIPADAKTYAQLAAEKDAKILLVKLVPDGYMLDGELMVGDIGYSFFPQQDGSVQFMFEVYGTDAFDENNQPVGQMLARAERYTLNLRVSNWEVASDGTWLREEPNDTYLRDNWVLTVAPQAK